MTSVTGSPLAFAFALVKGYDLREAASVWTLCIGRWRWPVFRVRCQPEQATVHMFGWIQGAGWVFS